MPLWQRFRFRMVKSNVGDQEMAAKQDEADSMMVAFAIAATPSGRAQKSQELRLNIWKAIRPAAALLLLMGFAVRASSQTPEERPKNDEKPAKENAGIPVPPETTSVTKHDLTVGGQLIHYTATAGNLLIRDEHDKPNASIFYVAYTQDGAEARSRPVTFFYNGGPGAATIWLHMGSFGPVRVITESP